jgi:predicted ATPase/DNA-binding CsgD family transcriptional regulator
MLGRVRALTLCGPGGIGKTRLALKLAASLAGEFPDGVWIADLADAQKAEQLVPLVTSALGIRAEPERPLTDTLTQTLRGRTMLLVLDTCEHLVQACAELVQQLLGGCPALRVIATSREALRVRGEVLWRVPPLGLPVTADLNAGEAASGTDSEAVRLFTARASAAWPGFSLNAENECAVAEICRTLDGVPLAIELAAARVRTLSVEQIRRRLAGKFELLAHGDRTAPLRQQTLRATVEWSYDLLTEPERQLLDRLSVFHSWRLDLAEQICADGQIPVPGVLDLLTALIDKSLVNVDAETETEPRYRLLDTVRELALELAGAGGGLPALRAAHRDCMLAMVERIAGIAFLRGDPPWAERVTMYHRVLSERANFGLALSYCVEQGEAESGLRLCVALSSCWLASGAVADGAFWTDRLLAAESQVEPGLRARALAVRAELAFEQQDYRGAARFATACLDLSRSAGGGNPATALRLLSLTHLMAGDAAAALAYAEQAVAAAREMGDAWEEGVALASRAAALAGRGELAQARRGFTEALEVLEGNNRWGVANVLYGLGQIARTDGDVPAALRYLSEALAIYRQIDARPEMARCSGAIGTIALSQPDLPVASASLNWSVQLNLATGQRLGVARGLAALAALMTRAGDVEQALTVAGAALALFAVIDVPPSAAAVRRLDELVEAAAVKLPRQTVLALLASGRTLSPDQAAALVDGQLRKRGLIDSSAPGISLDRLNGHGTTHGQGQLSPPAADRPPGPPPAQPPPAQPPLAQPPPAQPPPAHPLPAWPGPLTGRERDVARLIALGLSNRDIAQRLFISSATVARHTANIFAKLGFSSRAQVIAWVVKSGQGVS